MDVYLAISMSLRMVEDCHATLVYGEKGSCFLMYRPARSSKTLIEVHPEALVEVWLPDEGIIAIKR
jgi:hypothetical protein